MTTTATVPEAKLVDQGHGFEPACTGWYVVNVADAAGWTHTSFGQGVSFESKANRFEQFGVNIQVLEPGQPNCRYHNEGDQEAFLVLRGTCTLIVEEQERTLHAGDFFHCPPMTRHVFVGAGDAPCAILMIGGRAGDAGEYPVSAIADRHGASSPTRTSDPKIAYADTGTYEDARIDIGWVVG